jgi:single-stranded-DNA-specific exonuclease
LSDAIGLRTGKITAYNIAFGIGPHLNAAGRMGDADCVVELFLTDDEARMDAIIEDLLTRNLERRSVQDAACEACMNIVRERYPDGYFLLVRPPEVHEGVSGIVAGKLREAFSRPVAVLSDTQTETGESALKGSARSVDGVDIIGLLRRYQNLFLKLGGHAMAAGFTMRAEDEDTLRLALDADVKAFVEQDPTLFSDKRCVDWDLSPEDATLELAKALVCFEPTGTGNPQPLMRMEGVTPSDVRRIGPDGRHLKFSVDGLQCVMFGRGSEALLPEGPATLLGQLDVNVWNGNEKAQFIVRSAHPVQSDGGQIVV